MKPKNYFAGGRGNSPYLRYGNEASEIGTQPLVLYLKVTV